MPVNLLKFPEAQEKHTHTDEDELTEAMGSYFTSCLITLKIEYEKK